VIILSGHVEIGIEEETKLLKAGDIALEEDLTGQGHTARVVSDQPLLYAVVPLEV
jgi:quercetin dioxygenase-like cupin family protein